MKKKVFAALIAGCMAASALAGCGNSEGASTDKSDSGEKDGYVFEVLVKSFQSTYWQASKAGIDAAAEELGVEANTTGPNAESDIADQINMLNSAINKEPDGIALAACDTNAVIESLQMAVEKDVPVVCFGTAVPNAPEGSVYATVATNNLGAGEIAGEKLYEEIKDEIASADGPVRIGEVNQDATAADIIDRGMGFIVKFKELAEKDGYKVAVIGNEKYVNEVDGNTEEENADVIIEVAVPAQTTVELAATEASNIMNKDDTIAMFGSNQVTAEGILTADQTLNMLEEDIVAVGFDAGTTVKAAVREGKLFGAVTQAPVDQGKIAIQTLYDICEGKEVKDVETDCYWYDASNIDDENIAPNLYD